MTSALEIFWLWLCSGYSDPERSPLLPGLDPGRRRPSSSSSNESCSGSSSSSIHTLSSNSSINKDSQDVKEKSGLSFYAFLLRQRRCVGGVTCYIVYSMIISGFDTTLPLHVRGAFNWDSGPSGLMFLALQGPGILLGPLAGTLKDHIGTRCPAVIAFFIIGPSIWLMGLPGDKRFPWFNNGERGQILYIICMIVIGCMKPMLNSIGTLELTCKWLTTRFQHSLYPCYS
jgi:hypothetical protein